MSRRFRFRKDDGSFNISAGWLFADLLLALAMLFLAANTLAIKPPPTPPHIDIPPTTTATPKVTQRIVERNYCEIILNNNNPDKFRGDTKYAISVLEPQINKISFLKGRLVGIALAYGGTDNINSPDDRGRATDMATNVYAVLHDLGKHGPIFQNTSYYDPLFTGKHPAINVVIDVYLLVRSDNPSETCDSNHTVLR